MPSQPPTQEQFARLFAENHHRIFRFIRTLVPHRADADDVFQETSIVLWRELERFDMEQAFAPWAFAIAFNQVRSHRHRMRRSRLHFNDALLNELAAEQERAANELESRRLALEACLGKLPPSDIELITTYYENNATASEVAQWLGRPENTIYKGMQRIRRALHECIERRLAVEGA